LISSKIGHRLDPVILAPYRLFFRKKDISPNIITAAGTLFGFLSAFLVYVQSLTLGACALVIAGFLDLLDGAIARSSGQVTRFGGFFDSVLDRYTDLAVMGGILFIYVRHDNTGYAIAAFVATAGVALIPYARARAEAASLSCKTGILERPERLILLVIGLFFPFLLGYIMVALAVLTHVTVIQRILYVRKQTGKEG